MGQFCRFHGTPAIQAIGFLNRCNSSGDETRNSTPVKLCKEMIKCQVLMYTSNRQMHKSDMNVRFAMGSILIPRNNDKLE